MALRFSVARYMALRFWVALHGQREFDGTAAWLARAAKSARQRLRLFAKMLDAGWRYRYDFRACKLIELATNHDVEQRQIPMRLGFLGEFRDELLVVRLHEDPTDAERSQPIERSRQTRVDEVASLLRRSFTQPERYEVLAA